MGGNWISDYVMGRLAWGDQKVLYCEKRRRKRRRGEQWMVSVRLVPVVLLGRLVATLAD